MTKLDDYIKQIQQEADSRKASARKHYEAGKNDCKAGIYDKWYRYNTRNDGRAYDIGWTEQNAITKNETVKFLEVNQL